MKKQLIIAALAIVALTGCNKESSNGAYNSSNAVKFSSKDINTRTTQIEDVDNSLIDAWESGDKIGISTKRRRHI